MTLDERVKYFENLFEQLQCESSRLGKEYIVSKIPVELKDDFIFLLEILAGRRKIGWTYTARNYKVPTDQNQTLMEYIYKNLFIVNKTDVNIARAEIATSLYGDFIEPIVNRRWRLGIGPSLLEKEKYSPMLAKKFETRFLGIKNAVTEKLDGNRCIAYYENGWKYKSRNGKDMAVEFDMSGFDTSHIYDGEILSPIQVEMSNEIVKAVQSNKKYQTAYDSKFNSTSGLINRKSGNKDLIFNVFDVISTQPYDTRRYYLQSCKESENVRILPVLAMVTNSRQSQDKLFELLDIVTSVGGEGIMINNEDATYQNKRTKDLMKLKKAYSMDMRVESFEYGTGKYQYSVGALHCSAFVDGKDVQCKVGTGFSDEQRDRWSLHPEEILGKLVEVEYFSMSQDKEMQGTTRYSLRFPRFKRIRTDKGTTSID